MKKKILAFSLILSLSVSGMSTLAAKPESQGEMQEYTEDYEAEGEINDTEKVEEKTEEASEKADSKENANKETEEAEKTEEASEETGAKEEIPEVQEMAPQSNSEVPEVVNDIPASEETAESELNMLAASVQSEIPVYENGVLVQSDKIYYGQYDERQKGVLKSENGKLKYYVNGKFQSAFSGRLSGDKEASSDYDSHVSFYVKNGVVDTGFNGVVTVYNTETSSGGSHFYAVNGLISSSAFESNPDDPSSSMCSVATGLSIKNTADGIAVGYDRNKYGDDCGFYIYRLCHDTGEFISFAKPDGDSTGFADKNVIDDHTYTYYIWTYSFYNMWGGNGYVCGFVDLSITYGKNAQGQVNTYKNFTVPEDSAGKDMTWDLSATGVLTITGNGSMPDYKVDNLAPWDDQKNKIKSVIIKEGITTVGELAFYECTNLESVEIASSVSYINKAAFYKCISLENVMLKEGMRMIDDYAFQETAALTTIKFPTSLVRVSSLAFWNSGLQKYELAQGSIFTVRDGVLFNGDGTILLSYPCGLKKTSYSIPSGVTVIDSNAFQYAAVTSVNISNGVKKIKRAAFVYSGIAFLAIPDSVTEAGDYAVQGCKSLRELHLGGGIKSLSSNFAQGCSNLEILVLKEGIKRIENNAFANTKLASVDLPASLTYIEKGSFPEGCRLNFSENSKMVDLGNCYQQVSEAQIEAKYNYDMAFQVLDQVNQKRKENGLGALKMDTDLIEAAMLRAAEISIYFEHTRPTGQSCTTVNSKVRAENIAAGNNTAASVMNSWMNSSTHKSNILGTDHKGIGVGCVQVSGVYYWVQLFSPSEVSAEADGDSRQNYSEVTSVMFDKDGSAGEKFSVSVRSSRIRKADKTNMLVRFYNGFQYTSLYPGSISFSSSNPSVAAVSSEGEVTGVSEGTAEVKAYLKNEPEAGGTVSVTVTAASTNTGQGSSGNGNQDMPASSDRRPGTVTTVKQKKDIGKNFTSGSYKYKVTSDKEAAVTGLKSAKTVKVKIPRSVKYNGKTFTVTSIAAKAFAKTKVKSVTIGTGVKTVGNSAFEGCSKLSTVTIGKNVGKIGSNTFKNCKKLKKITIKSAKMKVGKNALKGIKSTAKIKVPSKKLSAYKKILKGKGQGSKVRITK